MVFPVEPLSIPDFIGLSPPKLKMPDNMNAEYTPLIASNSAIPSSGIWLRYASTASSFERENFDSSASSKKIDANSALYPMIAFDI